MARAVSNCKGGRQFQEQPAIARGHRHSGMAFRGGAPLRKKRLGIQSCTQEKPFRAAGTTVWPASPRRENRYAVKAFDTLTPHVRVSIFADKGNPEALFGRGVATLCRGVREAGSLNRAAKDMGMAYSKAWRIVKETEEAFGVQILDRNGAHGSTLTPEGEFLLSSFDQLEEDLNRYAEQRLAEILKTR